MNKIISIQGNLGSYSHIAAENIYGKGITLLERDTFKEVFEDLNSGRAGNAVIPIENSTHGSIFQNYDLLSEYNFHITNEIYLIINFHLIANPGVKFEDIKNIYTHPVALAQVRNFLEDNKQIKSHEFPDTGGAVKMIKDKKILDSAGAASRKAAEIYGMQIIREKIQHNKKNYTRFFCLAKDEEQIQSYEKGIEYKTTLQFELGEEAGSLYNALGFFNKRNISLTKIESRPIINTDWKYTFYLDFIEGMNQSMLEAIKDLKYSVRNFRILGSYERGKYVET